MLKELIKSKHIILLIFCIFIFSNVIYTQDNNLESPEINKDGIYFRYYDNNASTVYLKSSFDKWNYRYAFYKTNNGYWELRLPLEEPLYQLKKGKYKYKLLVDGITTYDPLNYNRVKDEFGIPYSILIVPYDLYDYSKSPFNIEGDIYRFFMISNQSKTVEIAGSFNNFVPEELKNVSFIEDLFYIDIVLSKGTYYYSFIDDGKWKIDERNNEVVVDITERKLSKTVID